MENTPTNNSNKMRINLLREEVERHDLIEDKTHEKVAESIAELIKSEKDGGVTIGLEGSWGSGKSFVIALLKERLEKSNSIKLIEFDAWAHQGDPLRRVFLESLIDEINSDNDLELGQLKDNISKRIKTARITSRKSITCLGLWLSISAFFVPVGLAIMSYLNANKENNVWLVFAFVLTCAPIIVILLNLLLLTIKRISKKISRIFSLKHWSFLKDVTNQEIKQEISEEDERSSIEFENYFQKILKQFFEKYSKEARLVIVIDNLDRVNSEDALKIWSTLQTFLQQRSSLRKESWFNKIWIVVPYDRDGLSALWHQEEIKHTDSDENTTKKNSDAILRNHNNNLAKAFFDKNFQIRYEISRPILSSWIDFLKKMVDQAFAGWDDTDKAEIVDILEFTRKNIADVPTPREIKNYVNQVGLFVSQFFNEITIKSIAYYVVLRQFDWLNKDEIRQKLINGQLPKDEYLHFLPKSIKEDLAGLVFGVSPNKGNLLLLEPEIKKSLLEANDKKLKELSDTHKDNFWDVAKHHIPRCKIGFKESLNYAHAFKSAFGDGFNLAGDFINKIKEVIDNKKLQLDFASNEELEKYKSIISICNTSRDKKLSLTLYNKTKELTEVYFGETKEVSESLPKFFKELIDELTNYNIELEQNDINFGSIENFLQWCEYSETLNTNLWEYILPSLEIISQIIIPTGKNIPQGTLAAVKYLISANVNVEWDRILDDSNKHIKHNDGTYQQNFHSDEVFEVITISCLCVDDLYQKGKEILSMGHYYNLLHHRKSQNLLHAAIVCGYIFGQDLQSINVTQVGQSSNGIKLVQQFWSASDNKRAKEVFNYIAKYEQYDFLWRLAEDPSNILVADIISLIANDDIIKEAFFNVEDGLSKIKYYKELIADSEKNNLKEITSHILKYGNLKNEIMSAEELSLAEYAEELVHVVSETEDAELINHISEFVKQISKDEWLVDLTENQDLAALALEIKKKEVSFSLGLKFYEAIIEFCISEKIENISAWQIDNWDSLIDLLNIDYKEYFTEKISKHFINKKAKVSKTFLEQTKPHWDKILILNEKNFLIDVITDALQDGDLERTKQILQLFNSQEVKKHSNTEKSKTRILKDILEANRKDGDDENKGVYKQIAELFGIKLEVDEEKSEEGEDEDDQKN